MAPPTLEDLMKAADQARARSQQTIAKKKKENSITPKLCLSERRLQGANYIESIPNNVLDFGNKPDIDRIKRLFKQEEWSGDRQKVKEGVGSERLHKDAEDPFTKYEKYLRTLPHFKYGFLVTWKAVDVVKGLDAQMEALQLDEMEQATRIAEEEVRERRGNDYFRRRH